MKKTIVVSLILSVFFLLLMYCSNETADIVEENKYLNVHDSVEFVGLTQCRSCHNDKWETFQHTGMGLSFDTASMQKSAGLYDHNAIVYDSASNFYYQPFWKEETLYFKEFRLEGKDTIYQRIEKISYVIGSGQHTNSHMVNFNGYLYQAPITFYTQEQKWDMAPGFSGGSNTRFSRIIESECLTCHNHYPNPVEGSINKYNHIPKGIECERCHGAGEIHVREKLAGNIIDTSKFTDYTIVNPANLTVEQQMDVCQRCHLQGVAVLQPNKDFYDFKPSEHLNEVMNVFLPRYTNSEDKFIMASQADRLKKSKCFKTGELSCINCHNPHLTVKETPKAKFNNTCKSCHGNTEEAECNIALNLRISENDNNCVKCHMQRSGSIDIPHVTITDHFIGKPVTESSQNAIQEFIGLECITNDEPTDFLMAEGYITFYEKFKPEDNLLDSTLFYINRSTVSDLSKLEVLVKVHFFRNEYKNVAQLAEKHLIKLIENPWTAYRIGESYTNLGNVSKAVEYLEKAKELQPYNLDFNLKLSNAYIASNEIVKAKKILAWMINEMPKDEVVYSNLGYIYMLEGKTNQAASMYQKAINLNPDYEQAWENYIGYYMTVKEYKKAKSSAQEVLRINPNNAKVSSLLIQLENY